MPKQILTWKKSVSSSFLDLSIQNYSWGTYPRSKLISPHSAMLSDSWKLLLVNVPQKLWRVESGPQWVNISEGRLRHHCLASPTAPAWAAAAGKAVLPTSSPCRALCLLGPCGVYLEGAQTRWHQNFSNSSQIPFVSKVIRSYIICLAVRLKGAAQNGCCVRTYITFHNQVQSHTPSHSIFPAALCSQQGTVRAGLGHTRSAEAGVLAHTALVFLSRLLEMLLLDIVSFQVTLLRFPSTKLIMMRCSKQVRTSKIESFVVTFLSRLSFVE